MRPGFNLIYVVDTGKETTECTAAWYGEPSRINQGIEYFRGYFADMYQIDLKNVTHVENKARE